MSCCPFATSGVSVVGDIMSVRGDLGGGDVPGLVGEHLFEDCFPGLAFVNIG